MFDIILRFLFTLIKNYGLKRKESKTAAEIERLTAERQAVFNKRIEDLGKVLDAQSEEVHRQGAADYDVGFYNGLLTAKQIITDNDSVSSHRIQSKSTTYLQPKVRAFLVDTIAAWKKEAFENSDSHAGAVIGNKVAELEAFLAFFDTNPMIGLPNEASTFNPPIIDPERMPAITPDIPMDDPGTLPVEDPASHPMDDQSDSQSDIR